MREVTKLMINEFNLKKLGYDFMGYTFKGTNELSFHHLIVPRRLCGHLEAKGYTRDNGVILKQSSSHDYLHVIENYDRERFLEITKLLIDENIMGRLDIDIIKKIRDILVSFELEYKDKTNTNGNKIIKKEFTNRIIL